MIRDERPIVFTISQSPGENFYAVKTSDLRADVISHKVIKFNDLFTTMVSLSETYNNKGYAVSFEVA